jgi:hypothetical protein
LKRERGFSRRFCAFRDGRGDVQVVDEPAETDAEEALPVAPGDESVWHVSLDSRLLVTVALAGHLQPPKQDQCRWHDTETDCATGVEKVEISLL